ncbi:MAG: 16S rRNA (uracil(1498)-N(3))-methyltransferase [Candidatus Omnitrophica bacterium]|nr:16S rRNA (uracil(1498)-N(3))-methyltransferase [Candidatus Omnitrophota bacterium]
MSKIRFYFPPCEIKSHILLEDKRNIHKIKNVLRLKEGGSLFIFDGQGKEYLYSIENTGKKDLSLKRIKTTREEFFPQFTVSLAFPLMREAKLDLIFQKATELGVFRFLPFLARRGAVVKNPSKIKLERWRKIIEEAARQSDRLWLPRIEEVKPFDDVIKEEADIKLAAYRDGEMLQALVDKKKHKRFFLIIGPEGDFSQEEKQKLKEAGFRFLKLSENILRSETAAFFSVGILNYICSGIGK